MTGRLLRRSQYDVSAAIGHPEAVDMLHRSPWDLVIVDCDMDMADCNQLIRHVKQSPARPPLLLLSGNGEDEVPLLKAGADDWMKKPYQMNVLLARMDALLRQKS